MLRCWHNYLFYHMPVVYGTFVVLVYLLTYSTPLSSTEMLVGLRKKRYVERVRKDLGRHLTRPWKAVCVQHQSSCQWKKQVGG